MEKLPAISVVVPCFNVPKEHIVKLYQSLVAQTLSDFEVLLIDDCSVFDYYYIIKDSRFKVVRQDKNSGPAVTRNLGVDIARSENIFFTDSDCSLHSELLGTAIKVLEHDDISMGNTITVANSFFGKAVGYLGFPGGGLIGFEKVWMVDELGYTRSISSCNLAIRKKCFLDNGCFDTTFPVPGGEDTVFCQFALANGYKIRYSPEQIVYHVEREKWHDFVKWQITRGRGNYHIKRKLGSVGHFLKLRIFSFANSLKAAGPRYIPLVLLLIIASVIFQSKGYLQEKKSFGQKVK